METECLSHNEFNLFLSYVSHIVERLGDFLFVLHTTGIGDVYWQYEDGMWCLINTMGV